MATILITGILPDLSAPLIRSLRQAGYFLLCAPDGDKAWQLLQQIHVDLLITDRCLPLLSGEALIRRLRSHERLARLPVIVTSTSEPTDLDAVWLAKPLQFTQVQMQIEALLRSTTDRHRMVSDRAV
jgi:DNA-binding response OmpR family regulator